HASQSHFAATDDIVMDQEVLSGIGIIGDQLYSSIFTSHNGISPDGITNILIRVGKQADLNTIIIAVNDGIFFDNYIGSHVFSVRSNIYINAVITVIFNSVISRIPATGALEAYGIKVIGKMVILN